MSLLYALDEEPLSPCSSCATLVYQEETDAAESAGFTIICPNLIDRITVTNEDLEEFVSDHLGYCRDITVVHLLLYLFSRNVDPDVRAINNLRLLHTGKQFTVQRPIDLQIIKVPLNTVARQFKTFQLVKTLNSTTPPLSMSIQSMVTTTEEPALPKSEPLVTYVESIVKKARRLRRRLSATENAPARTKLRDSETDVENDESHSSKFAHSFKRVFKNVARV